MPGSWSTQATQGSSCLVLIISPGRGSFGTVYRATYRGQEVAAKILNSQEDPREIEEFQKYASVSCDVLKCGAYGR